MILYFLRHAEAEGYAESDFVRNLTDKGREQAVRVGKFLRKQDLLPEVILTSPVVRAIQTARIVADVVGLESVPSPWLACGMEVETLLRELQPHLHRESVMLVGHEPDFSAAISALIGTTGFHAVNIRKATLAALELHEAKSGSARLQFLVPVRLM